MKKEYMKPAMRVVKLQQSHMLCLSDGGAKSLNNSDGISWRTGGFTDNEDDM